MTMHLTEDDLVLHYYGEMDAETLATSHLAQCGACQAQYTRLQRVMALVDSVPAVEPAEEFERIAWARLEAALPERRAGWLTWFVLSPARLAWGALVVTLVVGSFMAGRLMPRPANTTSAATAANSKVGERILLVDLGEHLDRSQMVLVELVNADGSGSVDVTTEQARAAQLLAANRLYRQAAVKSGDAATAAVLDELERVLVDIAASPSSMSAQELDQVRRRIESQELLFKVGVVSSSVRERQKAALKKAHIES